MYAGVAALAAIAGVGVAWKRQSVGTMSPEALTAFGLLNSIRPLVRLWR